MSYRDKKIICLSLLILLTVSSVGAEVVIEPRGEFVARDIIDIEIDDLDNDNMKELIVLCRNTLYVLDRNGGIKWLFERDNFRAVHIADINKDNTKEIVLSAGKEINEVKRGNFYVLDRNGKMIHAFEFERGDAYPAFLYNSLTGMDINVNGYDEIIGGSLNGVYAIEDTYRTIRWHYSTNETVTHVEVIGIIGEGSMIMATSFTRIFLLKLNGELVNIYRVPGGIKDIVVDDLSPTEGKEFLVISGDDKIILLDSNLQPYSETKLVSNIVKARTAHLDSDDLKDIILGTTNGLYLVNNRLNILNRYTTNAETKGIYNLDWDRDGETEIVYAAGNKLHWITETGEPEGSSDPLTKNEIETYLNCDLDANGYMDIVVVSESTISIFENNASESKDKARDKYISALGFLEMRQYKKAEQSLNAAISIYSDIGDLEGVRVCETLIDEIKNRVIAEKKVEADKYYESALNKLENRDYSNAVTSASMARNIYEEINDTGGLTNCAELQRRIDESMENETLDAQKKTEEIKKQTMNILPLLSMLLLVGIIILLAVLTAKKR